MNMGTFSYFLLFFLVLFVGTWYQGTSHEVYLLDGDTYAFDDLQFIAAEDRSSSSERFRIPISFIIIMIIDRSFVVSY